MNLSADQSVVERPLLGIRGCLLDAPEFGRLRSWRDGAVVIRDGKIIEVGEYSMLGRKARSEGIRWMGSDQTVLVPGLIDLHTHLPQYPVVARGCTELMAWLREHVYPRERTFTGGAGKRESAAFFPELARHGTTCAVLYTAIYEDSCEAAFHGAVDSRLRIVMGQMLMDTAGYSPSQPKKPSSVSLAESQRLCERWHGAGEGLIDYAFSPRFALACSEKLMREAGTLARQTGAYLQTHLSETAEECERVLRLFPGCRDYTEVYERCGMLGPRTLLGHAIHISQREREAIAASGAGIAHCPTANLFLQSGLFQLSDACRTGISVGIGSDVAAGPELNLWQVMRSTIETQKARVLLGQKAVVPTPTDVLHLATLGAATALRKAHLIGTFDVGKEADITAMDLSRLLPYRASGVRMADLSPEDILNLCIYRGGPDAVTGTFVRGHCVFEAFNPELF